jgi:plastocyanin
MNMKKLRIVSIGALLLLAAISVVSPVFADSTTTVSIKNGAGNNQSAPGFSPSTITVVIGVNATVNWVNGDTQAHTVTADSGNAFNSGNIAAGQSYTFTFTSAGTYAYGCTYHSWMHGTVIVKSGAVPEFPFSTLALILFGVVAVAAFASGRFKGKASTHIRQLSEES